LENKSINTISDRGLKVCRVCDSQDLENILDLGMHPIPSEYGATSTVKSESFPLHLRICKNCGLGQIAEYVEPTRIFHKEYPYISSASSTWIKHTTNYANRMNDVLQLNPGNLVLEIASNDGSLLSSFKSLGMEVLGIEPALNVALFAKSAGVPTVVEFFGESLARKIVNDYGYPKLIIANNVFAHVPNMQDFMKGLSLLSDSETIITIENPSFVNLLNHALFDTIYHEHYSYLTAHSVSTVANKFGLNLIKVESISTHGGSNRYWLSKNLLLDESVNRTLQEEKDLGLFNQKIWERFAKQSKKLVDELREWLIKQNSSGNTIVGYGAAHKGNTFLNAVGKEAKFLKCVVDASIEKQGKFLPGSQVPVVAPESLNSINPSDILILPWNISEEISKKIKELAPNARIWVAQPKIKQIFPGEF
jgi:hypothetical protein